MKHILIIDDDDKLAELLHEFLVRHDITLAAASCPSAGMKMLRRTPYDAIILDVMLPEMDGFETCRAIRSFSMTPIIMLSARGDTVDRVVGLEIGADDYLPKPFEPRELAARLHALMRRTQRAEIGTPPLVFEGLRIEPATRRVYLQPASGEKLRLELTTAEFHLLTALTQARPRPVSRDDLVEELRGFERGVFDRSIDILVSRLRAKIGDSPKSPRFISTIRGAGYAFIAPLKDRDESRDQET